MSTATAPFTLPALPFDQNALEPYISANTLSYHYGKHHQAYVNKLNELVTGTEYADQTLEQIIKSTAGKGDKSGIFNNAAQVWNHTFFWNSLNPYSSKQPVGEIGKKINEAFGSYDEFLKAFANAGMTQFGSGWAWLIRDENTVKIVKTPNAETPLAYDQKPLLTVDVWEHAYYLDYQNKRNEYLATVLKNLLNWEFAAQNWG
ncbi:MAG: superoxide dismutase [Candidatus Omnitrophica bacterium]|nr:superoxide dismutase [Candidatus Omnitrophota bacterium]